MRPSTLSTATTSQVKQPSWYILEENNGEFLEKICSYFKGESLPDVEKRAENLKSLSNFSCTNKKNLEIVEKIRSKKKQKQKIKMNNFWEDFLLKLKNVNMNSLNKRWFFLLSLNSIEYLYQFYDILDNEKYRPLTKYKVKDLVFIFKQIHHFINGDVTLFLNFNNGHTEELKIDYFLKNNKIEFNYFKFLIFKNIFGLYSAMRSLLDENNVFEMEDDNYKKIIDIMKSYVENIISFFSYISDSLGYSFTTSIKKEGEDILLRFDIAKNILDYIKTLKEEQKTASWLENMFKFEKILFLKDLIKNIFFKEFTREKIETIKNQASYIVMYGERTRALLDSISEKLPENLSECYIECANEDVPDFKIDLKFMENIMEIKQEKMIYLNNLWPFFR